MMERDPAAGAIVVVNYGSSALLAHNLVALGREFAGLVIVVDNYTDPAERSRVESLARAEVWVGVLGDTNPGFGAGVNRGVERARLLGAREYLILNPDASIDARAAATLLGRVRRDPHLLLAPRIVRPDGSTWFAGSDLDLSDGRIRSRARRGEATGPVFEWVSGACIAVADELWARVGGFDEGYFLYWEDVDLSFRVARAGGVPSVADDIVAVHAEGGTQGEGHSSAGRAKSSTYYFYNIRNRSLFASRNLDGPAARGWATASRRVAVEILLQGGRRQFLSSPGTAVVGFRALRAARGIERRGGTPAGAGGV